MVSFAPSTGGVFDKDAFMAARGDISAAGYDFDTWYNKHGQHEATDQFQDFIHSGGVVSMGVEPLNDVQKSALNTMSEPTGPNPAMLAAIEQFEKMLGQPTINPNAVAFQDEAAGMYRGGAAPVTFDDVKGLANPYADALKERVDFEGEKALAKVLARQGTRGAASFGDASSGQEKAFLTEELRRSKNEIDYKTFESAFDKAFQNRDNMTGAGKGFSDLAIGAQNLTTAGADIGLSVANQLFDAGEGIVDLERLQTQDQLGAGTAIRDFNQGLVDVTMSELLNNINFEEDQLNSLQQLLGAFDGSYSNTTNPGANSLQTAGGIADILGSAIGKL